MLNVLRARMRAYLGAHRVGVLSISGLGATCSMPVRYRAEELELDCLVPRWADVAYYLEENPRVLLVILSSVSSGLEEPLCWLEYRGTAHEVPGPDWLGLLPKETPILLARDLYQVIRLAPERIDLVDESQGWGSRQTLET